MITTLRLLLWALLADLLALLPDAYSTQRLRGDLFTLVHYGRRKRLTLGPRVVLNCPHRLTLGMDVLIAAGVWLNARGGVTLGDRTMIGPHTIIDSAVHDKSRDDKRSRVVEAEIVVGEDAWIGGNCTVNGGARIGRGTTIGSQSFVKGAIAEGVFAAGVPCVVKGRLQG
jgi:acetyltransferase-like isoleucine patch superfamily enzyme